MRYRPSFDAYRPEWHRLWCGSSFCFIAILVFAMAAASSAEATDHAIIESVYNQYYAAFADKNVDAVMQFVAPDAVFEDEKGERHDATQHRTLIQSVLARLQKIDITFTLKILWISKNKVTVLVEARMNAEIYDTDIGSWMSVVITSMDKETWEYRGDLWKMVHTVLQKSRMEFSASKDDGYRLCTSQCTQRRMICNLKPSDRDYLGGSACDDHLQNCMRRCELYR